jgi:hypothetical protein
MFLRRLSGTPAKKERSFALSVSMKNPGRIMAVILRG